MKKLFITLIVLLVFSNTYASDCNSLNARKASGIILNSEVDHDIVIAIIDTSYLNQMSRPQLLSIIHALLTCYGKTRVGLIGQSGNVLCIFQKGKLIDMNTSDEFKF